MRFFFFLITIFFTTASFAQRDTIFFNKEWKVCKKRYALYYRIAQPQTDGGYLITDYYLSTNIPQMTAFSRTIEPVYLEGKCTYYFPSGKKESEGFYEKNLKTDVWIRWNETGNDSTLENYTTKGKKENITTNMPFLYDTLHPFSIAARGKVASFFIIEDVYFLTYSIGTELAYKRHSLGVDYSWFRWRYEEDDNEDVGMYSQYELRKYFHVDYKLTFLSFSRPEMDVYFNLYDKIGEYTMWYDKYEDYDFGTRTMTFLQSTAKGTFNEPGIGFGFRKYAEKTGFGFDCSVNYGYRMSDTNEKNYITTTQTNFREHVKVDRDVFYMRMNCFYIFGK